MTRYTQKQLKQLVNIGAAVDVTRAGNDERRAILAKEDYLRQIGYAVSVYGCGGLLLQGEKTGTLYAVTHRSSAIFVFG